MTSPSILMCRHFGPWRFLVRFHPAVGHRTHRIAPMRWMSSNKALRSGGPMRNILAMVALLLIAPAVGQAQSPDGEAVYTPPCGACPGGPVPPLPTRGALRAYPPEAVETALSSFTMRRQGA